MARLHTDYSGPAELLDEHGAVIATAEVMLIKVPGPVRSWYGSYEITDLPVTDVLDTRSIRLESGETGTCFATTANIGSDGVTGDLQGSGPYPE